MSSGAPPASREPAGASLLLSGIRRGFVLAFVPVALAAQAVAWTEYALSGWYRPWSWIKIGFAYALTSARVGFDATASVGPATLTAQSPSADVAMEIAVGALTVLAVVLLFRAGREQGRLVGRGPRAAALAGATVAVGFATPCLLIALPVRLVFPNLGILSLRPVLWQAFAYPAALGLVCGIVGGLAATGGALDRGTWGARLTGAARGAWTAFTFGLLLSFLGFLVLAGAESGATGAYARFVRNAGRGGAVTVVHHGLLLPNQSALILATSMGAPVTLSSAGTTLAHLDLDGVHPSSVVGSAFPSVALDFGLGYRLFWIVPAAAAVLGGRRAGRSTRERREALARAALGGVGFAALAGASAWAASITLPIGFVILPPPIELAASAGRTALVALPWGVAGGLLGGLLPERGQEPEDDPPSETSA